MSRSSRNASAAFDRLAQQFERLEQQSQRNHQETNDQIAGLRQVIEQGLTRQQLASAHNHSAHLTNLHQRDRDQPLVPYHDLLTNEPIEGFPETGPTIETLNRDQLTDLFLALGMPPSNDNVRVKRTKLRVWIGASNM